MSITARDWALAQSLAPGPKFVLVVLADAADDQGVCWPRISTIAGKVGVSTRTVQRAIQYLVQRKLLTVEPRLRPDGSSSSNRYRLKLEEGVKLSPPPDKMSSFPDRLTPLPDAAVTHPRHRCQGEGDMGVTPLTERRTERELPLPQGLGSKIKSDLPGRGGGDLSELHLPKELLPSEREWAREMIDELNPPLDEWAAIIAAGDIRASPLGCLRALIKNAREGKFTPERGLRIAQARLAKRRAEARMAKLPKLSPADPDNPLVRRVQQIVQRQGKG